MASYSMQQYEINPYLVIFVYENYLSFFVGSFGRLSSAGLFPFTDTVGYAGESLSLFPYNFTDDCGVLINMFLEAFMTGETFHHTFKWMF